MSAKDCDRQLLDWLAQNGFASYAGGLAKNGIMSFDQFKVIKDVDALMDSMKMHKIFRRKFANAFNEQFGGSASETSAVFTPKPISTVSVTPTPSSKPQPTRFSATSRTPSVSTQKTHSIPSPHKKLTPQQLWKMKKHQQETCTKQTKEEPHEVDENEDDQQNIKLMELEDLKRKEELKLAQEKAKVEEEKRKLEEMKQKMEQQQQQIEQQRLYLEFQEQQKLKQLEIEAQKLKQKELIQQQENIRIERERIKLEQERQQKELALKEEEEKLKLREEEINKLREERQQIFYEKEEKEMQPLTKTIAFDDGIAPLQTLNAINTNKPLNITDFIENEDDDSDDDDDSDGGDGEQSDDESYVSSIISAHSVDHHINNAVDASIKKKKKKKKRKKKKKKKKKRKKKKKKEKAIINDDNSYQMNAMWDDDNSYNHYGGGRQTTDSSDDLSDETAGLSSKKKKKKKKGKRTVVKSAKHEKLLDPKYRKKEKEKHNLSRVGFKIKPNHRYRMDDGRIGICKFRGRTLFGKSSEDWAGILVEYGEGVHNGTVKGKTYFRCADGKGIMVRPVRIVEDLGLSDGTVLTNKMIKGSKQIQRLLQEIAYENQIQYEQRLMEKKRKKKHKHNRERDEFYDAEMEWRPPNFGDEYEEDHSDVFKPRNMYSQTLFKNDTKADKKLMMYEI